MKTIMSIDEYKLYKKGKISIIDLKMKNIKCSKLYNWSLNHKKLLANVAIFSLIVSSNIIGEAKTVDEVMVNLYFIISEALTQENPDEWLRAFFLNGENICIN